MKPTTWAMVVAMGLTAAPVFGQAAPAGQSKQTGTSVVIADKIKTELAQQMKISVIGRVTKGAPYSADTSTESVQVLADGNRIVNRTTTKVYRDSEGRTRTERTEPDGVQIVSISDPISGMGSTLYPETRTAYQNGAVIVSMFRTGEGNVSVSTTASPAVVQRADAEKKAAAAAGEKGSTFAYTMVSPVPPEGGAVAQFSHARAGGGNATREDLGEQMIEGVMATGTRTTTVIAAGAIGNEQPIRIVSEEWLSKDLGILLMTKYSDPRSGETTYRVSNISRSEPDPSLFQVPADYAVQPSKIKRDNR